MQIAQHLGETDADDDRDQRDGMLCNIHVFIDWLGEFNFSKHDDRFFVADLALQYRPSVLFID